MCEDHKQPSRFFDFVGVDQDQPDCEIEALSAAVYFMDKAHRRERERFLYYLVDRFFPSGEFIPSGVFNQPGGKEK